MAELIEFSSEDIEIAVGNLRIESMDDVIEKMKNSDWTMCISLYSRVEESNSTIRNILRTNCVKLSIIS